MGSSDPVNISEKLCCLLFQKNIPRNATDAIMTAITAIIPNGTASWLGASATDSVFVYVLIAFSSSFTVSVTL